MGGDYTRFTFTPRKNYSSVRTQQGRVRLDADENELTDIADRRCRAETQDIIGRCAVPSTTPNGFKIVPTGAGTFDILVGRLYADGLLAENHGRPPLQYDRRLEEMRGTAPVPYTDQPYFPAPLPPALPGTPGTTDLVFVDVWHREVTAIEDPALLDVALGGVDTATRVQTVWQVRALQDVGPHDCADPIPAWTAEIAPSPARLTTAAQPTVDPGDVCDVPSVGGFRGRENRLYRVEIHATGTVGGGGAATFKWSRDNASLTAAVEAIAGGTDLTLRRLGRDELFRFHVDDWVEVLDDRVEFRRQSGHMARITRIDDAARTITVAPPVPAAFAFDPTDPERHTRVRRWDQRDGVDPATGLLTVAAGAIALEDGVEISFTTDPAGGSLRVGDYWVFAARTADGSVERLDAAPPRGTIHHFCRLALVTWGADPATTTVLDCRVIWPPRAESCCTRVVHPGEDIQAAIDSLPAAGGCVCLKVGLHTIRRPLVIARANVTVHGETRGAVVRRVEGGQMFAIGRPLPEATIDSVRLESLTLRPDGRDLVMIDAENVRGLEIASCDLAAPAGRVGVAAGIQVLFSSGVAVSDNRIANVIFGVQTDFSRHVQVCRNELFGVVIREAEIAGGDTGVLIGNNTNGPCLVERNYIQDFARGVFAVVDQPCLIVENEIRRPARRVQDPRGVVWAIDVRGVQSLIGGNLIELRAVHHGGVRIAGRHLRVEGNEIVAAVEGTPLPDTAGIRLESPSPDDRSESCVIRSNHVAGPLNGIIAGGVGIIAARDIRILDNVIDSLEVRPRIARFGIALTNVSESEIARNAISRYAFGVLVNSGFVNRLIGNTILGGTAGAFLGRQVAAEVAENQILGPQAFGIIAQEVSHAVVTGNTIGAEFGSAIGIFLFMSVPSGPGTVRVCRNNVTGGGTGIGTFRLGVVEIVGNSVEAAGGLGIGDRESVNVTIAENRVDSCGFAGQNGLAVNFGILAHSTQERVLVEGCRVLKTGRRPDGTVTVGNTIAIGAELMRNAHILRNVVDGVPEAIFDRTHSAIVVTGAAFGGAGDLSVIDNVLTGRARRLVNVPPAIISILNILFPVSRFGSARCIGNDCRHTVSGGAAVGLDATIVVNARRLSVVGNTVLASSRDVRSFNFAGSSFITATSNITFGLWSNNLAGTWTNVPNQLKPEPAEQFNHVQVT